MYIKITLTCNQCSTGYIKDQLPQALAYIAGLVEQDISFTVSYDY